MKVTLHNKEVDLDKALPLVLRDWKALEKAGVTQKTLQESSISAMSSLLFHVLHKADNSITEEEVDSLELTDPVIQGVIKAVGEGKIDKPFLISSTASAVTTGGQQEMLMN